MPGVCTFAHSPQFTGVRLSDLSCFYILYTVGILFPLLNRQRRRENVKAFA